MEGDYVLNLSGFGGGANYYYPVAMIGNLSVDKDGAISGNYKIHVAAQQSTPVNRNFTGRLNLKKCVGTLKVEVNGQLVHTFTVVAGAGGDFALATGEVGLVVNGTASK